MKKEGLQGGKRLAILVVAAILLFSAVVGMSFIGSREQQEVTMTLTQLPTTRIVGTNGKQISPMDLSGSIEIDGSSTVYPITEAVAEEFMKVYPNVRVNVGVSGTGGGFKRFVVGEIDISDASRPIKESEIKKARENGIEWIEIEIGIDGIAVVVNKENKFANCLTVKELKSIWEPESKVRYWSDIRDGWPNEPIRLYGPGTDSGTFDYFTEVIVGESGASRPDYTASEDDNVLIQGIQGDPWSLGYFGYAYYAVNKEILKAVAIDNGNGCIYPTDKTIKNGEYKPLSRPLFIYVNKDALKKPEVRAFVKFYLENAYELVREVGYVPFPKSHYTELLQELGLK
jgi:phosphate transport system substrate-binding protein